MISACEAVNLLPLAICLEGCELRRAGIGAEEHDDGFTIRPGAPAPTRFATYDDHRMAMSLALLGLRSPGIEISDPGCVAKTYPGFFADLERLG